MDSRALLACVLVFASLYSIISADYAYSGCYLYSSTGGAPTNTFWAPFLPGNINLLNCSKTCQGTLQGYFGVFETQCACQASNSPALTPVATTMCNYYLGGASNGNIYVSGFTTPPDRVPYMTSQVPTTDHQYHDMGCYRVYNFQYGDDGPHDTINEPIFGTEHESLDNEGHISAVEQCAEICQSKISGVFGVFQDTCFCQEEPFVPAAAISVDNSYCDGYSVTITNQYQGSDGGSHRHEYHYIRLYQFAQVGATSPPLTTPAPTTAIPTTVVPTTAVSTTAVPTTATPTTVVSTTAVSTTAVSTTAVPTTATPTTAVLTTAIPTTAIPTTAVSTTAVPTTATPTTAVLTTAIPTTAIPTTAVSTTAVPTTAVHTTAIPTTRPATSKPTTTKPTHKTTTAKPTASGSCAPGWAYCHHVCYNRAASRCCIDGTIKPIRTTC